MAQPEGDSVSLQKYQAKRHFERSPEPKGTEQLGQGPLRFVVQKHEARRLHYDFRLELGGTLKSWAIPKGPSLNPHDKRLAVMVEDHPLEYAHFEGVIPKGNYGAGTVMIWDEGTYHSVWTTDRSETEAKMEEGLRKGHITFVLYGRKLKGEFALVKLKKGEANAWLLIKASDKYADTEDVQAKDHSVVSRRSMAGIARGGANFHQDLDLRDAPKAAMPRNVKPMLATPITKSFDRPGWIFEIKWDGYRAIAEVANSKIRLYSRKHLSFARTFAPILESLKKLGHEAVLDGEIVVLDSAGKSQFQLLQNYQKSRTGTLAYCVFDLLHLDGHDLRGLPLMRRKELLARILPELPNVKLSEHVEKHGIAFFNAAAEQALEGIVAKDGASRYHPGQRSKSWLKIKTQLRQEAIICGFTEPRATRQHFGSLALGIYEGESLRYIGNVGSGFTRQSLSEIYRRLKPLLQEKSPFKLRPKFTTPVYWVRPELACEVTFAGWSKDGHMRHPIFSGLLPDKPVGSVRRERAQPTDTAVSAAKPELRRNFGNSGQNNLRVQVNGHDVQLTNLNKLYWPEEGYTKGDLVGFYRGISAFILPYLADRPESLHRHPNGIHGSSFFQKDVSKQPPPEWVQTVEVPSDEKPIPTVLCQNEATLLYLANLGCIELNPWNSRVGSLDRPDYLLIDLDPEDIPFEKVIETAQAVHKVLENIGAPCLCKTSGKRGLHIYVPLGARYTHQQAKDFAELVVKFVHRQRPDVTSLLRLPRQRQQRVYLDWLQNGMGKTLAAPYSVRPHPGATVSTPLKWSEVRRGLDPARFTIKTLPKRLSVVGDLWGPTLSVGIDLQDCLERMLSGLNKP
jgi:bifunctional non-homologous end joining protein LigD